MLVLNVDFKPLNVCGLSRAIALLDSEKAEVLSSGGALIRTLRGSRPRPRVIRLRYHVRRPWIPVRVTRREVFVRDDYTCQYCGLRARELTIDHVIPRHLGGAHAWENVVCACLGCNLRKGGHTLGDTRMRLARTPRRPAYAQWFLWANRPDAETAAAWQPFLRGATRSGLHG